MEDKTLAYGTVTSLSIIASILKNTWTSRTRQRANWHNSKPIATVLLHTAVYFQKEGDC